MNLRNGEVQFQIFLSHNRFLLSICQCVNPVGNVITQLGDGDVSVSVAIGSASQRLQQRIRKHPMLGLAGLVSVTGADFSGSRILGDLSISDIALTSGTLTFHRASIVGTARLMVTLQRDPQMFGGSIDLSNAKIGRLVISSGDRENQGEYTGPPRWDLGADVFLKESTVDTFQIHNVKFLKAIDLTGSKIRSVQKKTAHFSQIVGAWPIDTEFYSCFISYSSKDQAFTEYLHARLTESGVQCWYAPKDLKIGDPFRQRIEDAIHEHNKLLLVLSEESVKSDWVREEVEACFERERREGTPVLFPIRLDDAIMNTHEAWAASIRRQRHMGDFRGWLEPEKYREGFERLLRDLRAASDVNPSA